MTHELGPTLRSVEFMQSHTSLRSLEFGEPIFSAEKDFQMDDISIRSSSVLPLAWVNGGAPCLWYPAEKGNAFGDMEVK